MWLLRWLFNAVALIFVAEVVPGFSIHSFWTALIAALVLGLLNASVRWVLIFLTLPINILTLGLFTFVINALMILLTSSIVRGFDVTSFGSALAAALILWLISLVVNLILKDAA